ncbi:MAG: helix-turn-helix transcriptional regulator [Candidatus Zhuqueibacterota bacterium]
MSFNIVTILLLLAAVQGLLLTVLIFQKYRRLYANRFLGVMMCLYSIILFQMLLTDLQFDRKYPHVMFFLLGISFLMGPLHYLYTKSIIISAKKFVRTDWLHFLPFLIFELLQLPILFEPAAALTAKREALYRDGLSLETMLLNWLILAQILTYMTLTLVIIRRYDTRIKNLFSTIEKIKLNWIRNITLMAMSVVAIFLLENTFFIIGVNVSHFFNLTSILFAVFVYAMGYMGLSKSEIFAAPETSNVMGQAAELIDPASDGVRALQPKYEKSGLSPEKAGQYTDQLRRLMESEKPYRDCELTLGQLAHQLSISPHNLSEIINTQMGLNFFDFVNSYRIEDVKQSLADPQKDHIKILALAFDAGFNSKTTFNTIFKKHTRLTPSEYRARLTGRS